MQKGCECGIKGAEELDTMVVAADDVLALADLWTVSVEQVATLVELRNLFTDISYKILRGEVPRRVDMHLLH